MFASPEGGREPGPAPEGSRKGSDISITQPVGDVFQRYCGIAQEHPCRIEADSIQKFPESCPVFLQTPRESPPVHPEGARYPVLADATGCQLGSHDPPDSIYCDPLFPNPLFLPKLRREEFTEKGIRAGNRAAKECCIEYHGVAICIEANRCGEMGEKGRPV